jgi:prepilin-type N-terminal cleavage/methylation domain-containing protein
MFTLKNKSKAGFTIVELLIVIVVIGILATLVIVTFSGIQQKGRDTQRKTDINALQSHVESYYAQNGFYPSFGQLSDPAWRSTNLKGLDPEALKDPKGASLGSAASTTSSFAYGYQATHDDGTACPTSGTTDDNSCTKYTLTAAQEATSTVYTKASN